VRFDLYSRHQSTIAPLIVVFIIVILFYKNKLLIIEWVRESLAAKQVKYDLNKLYSNLHWLNYCN